MKAGDQNENRIQVRTPPGDVEFATGDSMFCICRTTRTTPSPMPKSKAITFRIKMGLPRMSLVEKKNNAMRTGTRSDEKQEPMSAYVIHDCNP